MIVLTLLKIVGAILLFVLSVCSFGFFAQWAVKISEMTTTVVPLVAKLYNWLFEMGAWIPGRTLGVAFVALFGIVTTSWCIKLGRMILSLFTGGGGNASGGGS